ncbi:MAG: EamA family transporter, partial [Clostridia bacterium]|nr:EamA family transporter [Clostridia bacterium]
MLAFVGAAFVVHPTFSIEILPALAGVGGGMCAGLAYTFVRKMGKGGVNGNLIIFVFSVFSCV